LIVHLLEGAAAEEAAVHLADEEDHRRGVLAGGVHPVGGVGGAGAAGDEADARAAGELAVGVGHVGGGALVAGDDGADVRRGVQRVEHRQVALAGDAEDLVDAVAAQGLDEDLSTVADGAGG